MSDYEGKKEAAVKGPEEVDMPSSELEDSFNVLFNVIVAETETNEIDNEFTEAVSEIEGKKSFECEKCGKVCKSKGGLTRHTNSKHAEPNTQSETTTKLDKDTVDGFVEAIKAGIIDEGLYENSTVTALETVTTTEALYISCCSSHL